MIKKTTWLIFGLIFLLTISGCDRAWNAANRQGVKHDVQTLLDAAELDLEPGKCEMIGSTRSALCTLTMEPDQAAEFVFSLNLITPDSEEMDLFLRYHELENDCRYQDGFRETDYQVFLSGTEEVIAPGEAGAGLESLLFYFLPDDGSACIQIRYGYG